MQSPVIQLKYPSQKPSVRAEDGREQIFCIVRKKWVVLSPEEWVRQNFLLFLIHSLEVPLSLIAIERQIKLGEMMKRFDLLVFDRQGNPFLVVECKEMNVSLSESVLHQAMRYNINLRAPYLAVTNGIQAAVFEYAGGELRPCSSFPEFREKKDPA